MRKMNTAKKKKLLHALLCVCVVIAVPLVTTSVINSGMFPAVIDAAAHAAENAALSPVTAQACANGDLMLYSATQGTETLPVTLSPETQIIGTTAPQIINLPAIESTLPLLSQNISDITENLSVFNKISGCILKTTITANGGDNFLNLDGGGQVWNCTDLSNSEVKALMDEKSPVTVISGTTADEPQVLIMHTHTMESYEYSDRGYYDSDYNGRSADPTKSVVAVGQVIAEEIAAAGISVIHDGTIHDELYNGAYERSSQTVKQLLARYPSIKVVLDIHRDALEESDGTRLSVVKTINGKQAAQIMIISAADDGTYDIPDYKNNFRFACCLQQQIESDWNGLTRPVLFQYCQYNQQLCSGSLLIEVGGHANTLEQALYSAHLLGKSIAKALLAD